MLEPMLARTLPLLALTLAPPLHAQLTDMRRLPGVLGRTASPNLVDLDGDGRRDVLYVTDDPDNVGIPVINFRVAVQTADALGDFGTPRILGTGPGLSIEAAVLVDDADGDGDLDLWVAGRISASAFEIELLENDGTTQFTSSLTLSAQVDRVTRLQRIDLDGDGVRDLAVLTGGTSAGFFGATATGTFGPYQVLFTPTTSVPHRHGAIEFGDLDGDGDVDVLASGAFIPGTTPPRLASYENTNGFPIDPSAGATVLGPGPAAQIALSDLDGDGDPDALARPLIGTTVELFENQAGALTPRGTAAGNLGLQQPMTVVDFDLDGDDDLLTVSPAGMEWRENTGALDFAMPDVLSSRLFVSPGAVADVDGNGFRDLLVVNSSVNGSGVFLFSSVESGGQVELEEPGLSLADLPVRGAPAILDANNDGTDDIATIESFFLGTPVTQLVWKRAQGGGTYAPSRLVGEVDHDALPPATGDFDGDGFEDIALASGSSTEVVLYRGDGAGNFQAPTLVIPLPSTPTSIHAADMNSDGLSDVIVVRGGGSSVGYSLGAATGTFSSLFNVVGNFPSAVTPVPADVDADGRLDLIFAVQRSIELARQLPSGQFAPRTVLADLSNQPGVVTDLQVPVVFDVDQDGVADVVFSARDTVWWLRGVGGGAFAAPTALITEPGTSFGALIAMHIDGDAAIDLAVQPDAFSAAPRWALNTGGGTFGAFQDIVGTSLSEGREIFALDADGDGDDDLLSTTFRNSLLLTENTAYSPVGVSYCNPAVPNSTGSPATITASGSSDVEANALTLRASFLPPGQFGIFVASQSQGFVPGVPNSEGNLCLGGMIGRFVRPGEIRMSGTAGAYSLDLDLTAIPTPMTFVPVLAGDTWFFQSWFRDVTSAGNGTSNFTDGVRVDF